MVLCASTLKGLIAEGMPKVKTPVRKIPEMKRIKEPFGTYLRIHRCNPNIFRKICG
jgi:hypothetical protein